MPNDNDPDFGTVRREEMGEPVKVKLPEHPDTIRLNKLEAYLADGTRNLSQPNPDLNDPTWQFGYNAGPAYHTDAAGNTLREAIDELP